MEVVGGALLSAFFDVLFEKLTSSDLWKFARQEKVDAELKEWVRRLSNIREELEDAEEKQITKESVKTWVADLRDLAYDMEDVLDEFAYEALGRKIMGEPADRAKIMREPADRASTSKVRRFLGFCNSILPPIDDAMHNLKMNPKVKEISSRLQKIYDRKDGLGLEKVVAKYYKFDGERPITTTLVHEPWVYGRDADKKAILDMLRDESIESNVSVVSIVAMGGMGKTTLARMVYDDADTAKHFDLKAWVCVSDQFDASRITKTILNSLASYRIEDSDDFNQLQEKLRERLKGKRFLLVLDDLWNEKYNDWNSLRSPFWSGAVGSKIIVTTRSRKVATMMGGDKYLHDLKQLSEDECWSVFEKHAFENSCMNEHQHLASIGREIVKKCAGLPLAVRALGGLLRNEKRENKWSEILTSRIWDMKECDILPALRLSYTHLPSHLKRCFAYCALFPKDYEFDKEQLVFLWMAESLIHCPEDGMLQMEDLGDDYFQELLCRSFYQPSSNNEVRFVMHDLVHDLAKSVATEICFSLEDNLEANQQPANVEKIRHASFICGGYNTFKKFEPFHKMKHLRSFIALPIKRYSYLGHFSNKMLQKLMPKLRVLSLCDYKIREIPDSLSDLIHLRYLNLSQNDIEDLPNSIGNLYNLQTLILSFCSKLTRLPNSIENLINLRHLDISGCNKLEGMPFQISKLKKLRVLSNFIVGKEGALKMKELKNMPLRQGGLCLSKLENVTDVEDAKDAGLNRMRNLEELRLEWRRNGPANDMNQMDVLSSLHPPLCLKKLAIESYGGPKFPHWMTDASLSKLVDLSLVNCRKCSSLPCLGRLPLLKQLTIQNMHGVEEVSREFYGPNNCFISLESLRFISMPEWEHWEDCSSSTKSSFPRLSYLRIWNCPKLIKNLPTFLPCVTELEIQNCEKLEFPLPRLPSLSELTLRGCNEVVLRSEIELTSLKRLQLDGILGRNGLHEGFVRGLQVLEVTNSKQLTYLWENGFGLENLEKLYIRGCGELVCLGAGEDPGLPCNIQSLVIEDCSKLERLPNGWQSVACLGKLIIRRCPNLVPFSERVFLPMLKSLTIDDCKGVKSLLEGMVMKNNSDSSNTMSLLESLEVAGCPSLICFPKGQLPTTLKTLVVRSCQNLKSLPEGLNECSLEYLKIESCSSLIGFPRGELPTTLKELRILYCGKLESLPEGIMHHHHSTIGLQVLSIEQCSSLTSFPRGKFPSTLEQLHILDCAQLESISADMFHFNNHSLQYLIIRMYPNLKTLPECLYNLRKLCITNCQNLELMPHQLQKLTSLTALEIRGCHNIKTPLSQWGLSRLSSLKQLTIGGMFPEATCFSEERHFSLLPTTLTLLSIDTMRNLESLASLSLQTLTSLEWLSIIGCYKLHSILPRDGMLPDTLQVLHITSCPHLYRMYSKEDGRAWRFIAHIPDVNVEP